MLETFPDSRIVTFDQGCYGAACVKPTGLWCVDPLASTLEHYVKPGQKFQRSLGVDRSTQTFRSAPLARFPPALCQDLGKLIAEWAINVEGQSRVRKTWESPWAHLLFPSEVHL